MATSRTQPILLHLRRAFAVQEEAGASDALLLRRFVGGRDERAFEALVRRHGPMVRGVCRRILGDPDEADDAFQATFLVLATKAASVAPAEMLPNWLYGVARQTAVRARSAKARRRRRERHVVQMPEPPAPTDPGDDLRSLLDEELAHLPGKYRVAVVLCDLEGRSHKDAAARLGWPVGTVASRHSRGRKMLKDRLARRGVGAAVLSPGAVPGCLPPALVSSTVRTGALYGLGKAAGAVSPEVVALTQGVLKAMSFAKMKTLVAVLLTVSLMALGVGLLARHATAQQPGENTTPTPKPLAHRPPRGDRSDLREYRQLFIRTLAVIAEYFEEISYANQYDGRIEASRPVPGNVPTRATRQAFVAITARDDGRFSTDVRVNKVIEAGGERKVVGRDAELERVILRRLNVPQGQKVPSTARKDRLEVQADGKQVRVRAVWGDEELQAVADRLSHDGGGVLILEGDVRVEQRWGGKTQRIEGTKVLIDRKTGGVRVDGAKSVQGEAAGLDFEVAEYYRRTGHPGAAAFCYELVCRRHPDSSWCDRAKQRLAEVRKQTGP